MPTLRALDTLIQKDPQLAFLRALLGLAQQLVDPDEVLLFGSRARGDAQRTSDVDLAFAFSRDKSANWGHFCVEADDALPTLLAMDLVDMAEADASLLAAIHKEGILIYERANGVSDHQS